MLEALPWIVAVGVLTTVLFPLKGALDKAHIVLLYLMVVLGSSARRGRGTGLVVSLICFLFINFFLLPPYRTLRVADPWDWLVLITFLLTSLVAAELLHRAQRADASERRKSEEVGRLSAQNAVLASVSHDLRTPLTTIKGLAHEIRQEGDDRAATIEQEADRLHELVTDLLDFSRLDRGALELHPDLNAADDLLGAALDRVSGHPRFSSLHARIDASEPLFGRFDFSHSLRALVNLIENALKYSPPNSDVEVVMRRDGSQIISEVLDRGPGIPASSGDRIFEPFFRLAGSEPDVGGTGLGLAIARRVAEGQGGTIRYAARPGGGSIFALTFPALDVREVDGESL